MRGIFDMGAAEPAPQPFNMAGYVLRHADRLAHKAALEVHGLEGSKSWSYAQIAQAVREAAHGLCAHGLVPGDKVLIRLGNSVEFPIVFLAALWAGLVPVPTSAALTQAEVDWIAGDLAPRLCVGDPTLPLPESVPCVFADDLHRAGEQTRAHMGSADRPGYIIYTSGSSGTPRAVLHAHRAIWARRMMYEGWYGLTMADRVLHAGAFNWTYTLGVGLMDPWAMGATAVIRDADVENAELPVLLRRSKATIFAASPGVYRQVLKSEGSGPLPELRHGLSAGEALPDRIREAWNTAYGTEIYEALGMSECSTYISACPGKQAPRGFAGFVQKGRRVTILNESGSPAPFGSPGTLAIHKRDPGLMLGYLNATSATADRLKGAWFDTGDQAILREDGAVQYLGRDDDMMNAGGYRVAPLEVEAAFSAVPGLSECAAIELEVKSDTRVIALFYTGQALDEALLDAHAATTLARYKQPRVYIHRDSLPHNANGKLNRKALRTEVEAQL